MSSMTGKHVPTPLRTLPPRVRERREDRISVSSILTASTSTSNSSSTSSSSTSYLVTPTSPSGSGILGSVYLSVPSAGEDDEDKWDVPTPKAGSFLDTHTLTPTLGARHAGMTERGDTRSWWGGNTPKLGPQKLVQSLQYTDNDTSSIISLEARIEIPSPILDQEPETQENTDTPLDGSPTLGAQLDDSPTLPPADDALAESPTLPSFALPPVDDLPSRNQNPYLRMPPVRSVSVERRSCTPPPRPTTRPPTLTLTMEDLLAGPVSVSDESRWSERKLGKRPEMIRTVSEGMSMERSISSRSLGLKGSPTRPRSSSSGSSSSIHSIPLSTFSTHSAPSIPSRSSSKGIQSQRTSTPSRPPLPPARGSSLRGSSRPLLLHTQSSSAVDFPLPPLAGPSHPALSRTISTSRSRPSSPLSYPPLAGLPLRRQNTTSSSFSSTLDTVLELPRDLDCPPEASWALRPPPRRLHRSKSQPNLRNLKIGDNEMNIAFKLRLKRSGSTHFPSNGLHGLGELKPSEFRDKGSRFLSSLRKSQRTIMSAKMLVAERESLGASEETDPRASRSSLVSSSVFDHASDSVVSTGAVAPRLDFGSDFFTPPEDFVFPEPEPIEIGPSRLGPDTDLAPPIDLIGEVSKDLIITPPPSTMQHSLQLIFDDVQAQLVDQEKETVQETETEVKDDNDLRYFEDAQLSLMAMSEAENWSWPDPPIRSRSTSTTSKRSTTTATISPRLTVPTLTTSATVSTLNGLMTPPLSPSGETLTLTEADVEGGSLRQEKGHSPVQSLLEGDDVLALEQWEEPKTTRQVRMSKGSTPKRELKTRYRKSMAPTWI